MTDRPWLKHYGALPHEITSAAPEMITLFRRTVAARGEAEAIRYFDGRLSWNTLDALSDALAVRLVADGVRRGDRVSIILQNEPDAVIGTVAAWKIGATPHLGNPMYRPAELAHIFADCRPAAVICADAQVEAIRTALGEAGLDATAIHASDESNYRSWAGEAERAPPPPPFTPAGAEIGLLLYTSGTTGMPKGAMLRHDAIAFNASAGAAWMRVEQDSRIAALAPLFHVTGFMLHMAVAIEAGCAMALCYRFDPLTAVAMLRAFRPTTTIAAITAFNALAREETVTAADFASFDIAFSGGAPIAPALRDHLRERLGVEIHPAYGMTETTSITHVVPPGTIAPTDAGGGGLSIGLPISSTEACITDDDGNPLPPREPGELRVRGPQIMAGYYNKPVETAAALSDGWMRTGDVGFMDEEGWFYLVDRKKDMIIASGFKVWPREVEDVLYAHPAVLEAAVVGAPDEYRGETVHAYLSLRPGQAVTAEALEAHCRERLAAYKVPRRFVFLDALPKTATGKIQRAALRGELG